MRESIESRRAAWAGRRYRTASIRIDQCDPAKFVRAHLFTVAACVLLAAAPAHAQVYKCADERNQPVYQDAPCPPGRELRNFAADPATVSVIPFRLVPGTTTRAVAPTAPRVKNASVASRKDRPRAGDAAERRFIHPGMHEGEVLARAGPPDLKSGGSGRKVARWTYMPAERDPQTVTTVVFDSGQVVEVERKVVR
jgi:hypothetical protein